MNKINKVINKKIHKYMYVYQMRDSTTILSSTSEIQKLNHN